MSNKKDEYFVPEQLEDNDFEKEKREEKKIKKEKIFEFDKKKVAKIVSLILVVVLIGVGIYLYLNPIEKKATAPEKAIEDFCAYFNAGNWKKINSMMDLKGYYVLGIELEEAEYTKFDSAYKNLKGDDPTYLQFKSAMKILTEMDEEELGDRTGVQIRINNIESCNKIQNTDTLYKLRVNFDYVVSGQSESMTGIMYVSNASGEYKIVFGEWLEAVLNYYNSIYMLQSSYGY